MGRWWGEETCRLRLDRAEERITDLVDKRAAAEQALAETTRALRDAREGVWDLEARVAALLKGAYPDLAAENQRLRRLCAELEDRLAVHEGRPVQGGVR